MESIILYHFPGSVCCAKVRLMLEEKQLPWYPREVNLLSMENYDPDYVQLNENCVVPTLVDEDRIVTNSLYILLYLDRAYPDHPLTPDDEEAREVMKEWLILQDEIPLERFLVGNSSMLKKLIYKYTARLRIKELEKQEMLYPELKTSYSSRKEIIEEDLKFIEDAKSMNEINEDMELLLDKLEHHLRQQKWLAGDSYSLADLAWTAILHHLDPKRSPLRLWGCGVRPAVTRYYMRLKSRASFEYGIIDHPITLTHIRPYFQMVLGSVVQSKFFTVASAAVCMGALAYLGAKLVRNYSKGATAVHSSTSTSSTPPLASGSSSTGCDTPTTVGTPEGSVGKDFLSGIGGQAKGLYPAGKSGITIIFRHLQ
eukprot:Nk52_evm39s295 gene=Nk52_evmTU39s295